MKISFNKNNLPKPSAQPQPLTKPFSSPAPSKEPTTKRSDHVRFVKAPKTTGSTTSGKQQENSSGGILKSSFVPAAPQPAAEAAPKKRGRPSNEEVARAKKEKLDAENKIKDQIIQNAGTAQAEEVENAISEISVPKKECIYFTEAISSIIDGSIPLFKVGEFVRDKTKVGKKIYKGFVIRQDLDAPKYVFIQWKNGSRQWHGAASIERITQKEFKKREEAEQIEPDLTDAKIQEEFEKIMSETEETKTAPE